MKCIFFLCFLSLISSCGEFNKGNVKNEKMPSISLLLLDSMSVLNTRDLPTNDPVILFFFEPSCPYCRAETESILKNIGQFRNTQFCFISSASLKDVKDFELKYKLRQYGNIRVGIDTGYVYVDHFRITGVPHTSLYRKGLLQKIFPSNVDAKRIVEEIDF